MCNLYSMVKTRDYVRGLIGALRDLNNNQPPIPGIFPDYAAPIVRMENGERIMQDARWGLPSSRKALLDAATKRADKLRAKGKEVDFDQLLRMEPDGGTTNVRNTASSHWKRWLGPANRCLVPLTSFAEPEVMPDGSRPNAWFALDDSRPLAFFAGIYVPAWTSVRKMKEGEVTSDLYGFLTCDPNADVAPIHPKAMPVIFTKPEEWDAWLTKEWDKDRFQRPLPGGMLKVVARGGKSDGEAAGDLSPEPTFL